MKGVSGFRLTGSSSKRADGPGWWRSLDLDQDWLGLWTALVLRLGYIRRLDLCFIPSLVQRLLDLLPGGILNLLALQVFLRFGFCAPAEDLLTLGLSP